MSKNKIKILILLVVLLAALVAVVMYDKEEAEVVNTLPEGWSISKSELCNVEIPLPPKEEPYLSDQGEYWFYQQYPGGGAPFFENNAITLFHNPELGGSGYVAGAVTISCKANANNDSTAKLVSDYKDYLATQNANAPEDARIKLIEVGNRNLWDRNVTVVNFKGGMFDETEEYYFLATETTSYLISKPAMSLDSFVRETTEKIFDGLEFR